jgi:dolichyl-phosphate-mannose-protein mannosyltransferase
MPFVKLNAVSEEDNVPVRADRAARRAGRRWYTTPFAVIAAVTALAGGLRLYHLSIPSEQVFDEVYYAKDACFDAGIPFEECGLDHPREQTFTAHPPLGRWIIAGGIAAFGNRAFGWRVASAVFGTLSVLLVAILALRLFGSALWAGAAGLLLAVESLNFVQSRISMLDIFLATFVVAGFLFLLLDRRWVERRTPQPEPMDAEAVLLALPPDRPPSPIFRPWRLAAGLAFGAAVATKWSGATALVGAVLLALAWERTRRREVGLAHPVREAVRDEGFGIFLFLVIVPVLVYVASYTAWWVDNGLALGDWWGTQVQMARFHIGLRSEHPYSSRAWEWILLRRPVAYYYQCARMSAAGSCLSPAEILGIGNQAVFWGSLVAIPYALASWWRKRDWRAGLIVTAFASQYVPWFFAARTNFLFYMTPITPFMVLGVVYALRDLSEVRVGVNRSRAMAVVAGCVVGLAVALFLFYLPILTGRVISQGAWRARMWFPSWI